MIDDLEGQREIITWRPISLNVSAREKSLLILRPK